MEVSRDTLYIAIAVLFFLITFQLIVEVKYFVRLVIMANLCKLWHIRKKIPITQELTTYGICLPSDIDFLLHMNHTKYLREFEFSRLQYLIATGLCSAANSYQANMVITALTIRYRRSVRLFDVFRIRNKLLYWNGRDLYVENRLETVRDKFIRAICITKLTVTNGATFKDLLSRLSCKDVLVDPPEPKSDLKTWLECNSLSSARLKEEQEIRDLQGAAIL